MLQVFPFIADSNSLTSQIKIHFKVSLSNLNFRLLAVRSLGPHSQQIDCLNKYSTSSEFACFSVISFPFFSKKYQKATKQISSLFQVISFPFPVERLHAPFSKRTDIYRELYNGREIRDLPGNYRFYFNYVYHVILYIIDLPPTITTPSTRNYGKPRLRSSS